MPRQLVSDTEVFKLLNHPLRRRIITILKETDTASSSEIAAALSLPLNRVTHHVRRLRDSGVITIERVATEGRPSRSKTYYRLRRRPEDFELGEAPEGHDELASFWREVGGIDGVRRFDIPESLLAGRAVRLDSAGRRHVCEASRRFALRIREIEAEAAGRFRAQELLRDASTVALVTILCEGRGSQQHGGELATGPHRAHEEQTE